MAKRLGYASALALAGLLVAAPAGAVEDFSGKKLAAGSANMMGLYGSTHAIDDRSSKDSRNMPEPAGWLLMLVGFGVLGAMNRRSSPHPMHDELSL